MVFWANKEYSRSWTRCLYARFPHAEIIAINKGYPNGWIKVKFKNNMQLWKGQQISSH